MKDKREKPSWPPRLMGWQYQYDRAENLKELLEELLETVFGEKCLWGELLDDAQIQALEEALDEGETKES